MNLITRSLATVRSFLAVMDHQHDLPLFVAPDFQVPLVRGSTLALHCRPNWNSAPGNNEKSWCCLVKLTMWLRLDSSLVDSDKLPLSQKHSRKLNITGPRYWGQLKCAHLTRRWTS